MRRQSLAPIHSPAWQRHDGAHLWMPYTQMQTAPTPLPVVGTEGVHLLLSDGRRLIDGLASWWTACHGYNHPHLVRAIQDQARVMPHVMFGGLQHEPAARLAARLTRILPGPLRHVFFSDSGSVAVEVAMKMAVQYWLNQGVAGRHKFVCFRHAYHGDTTGAMSLCDPVNSMHAHFQGVLLRQYPLEIPESDQQTRRFQQFLQAKASEIAAVVIEPLVQGAGGMKFHSPEALARVRQACDHHQLLLIADEIATGFGRTGTMFACEQAAVAPDIICIGKALTGGVLPLAATIASDRVYEAFLSEDPSRALMHGPTFMANPLACAAANASLDLFESEPRLEQVRVIERIMWRELQPCREISGVVDVRCKGAVGVVQVQRLHHLDRLRSALVERGVWLRPFGDMIYLTPALTITAEQLQLLCATIVEVVEVWSRWEDEPTGR